MTLQEHVGELVVLRCWCGVQHAVPKSLRDMQMRQHNDNHRDVQSIYCPLGHQHIPSGQSDTDWLNGKLTAERARHDQTSARLREERLDRRRTERRLSATKGVVTRTKNRIAAGVCPCCKRTFKQLAAHMQNKHPYYGSE